VTSALPDHWVLGTGETTVFLLHGMYGAKEYWRPEAERLTALGYRVVAWDAPGYGTSPLPENFTLASVAAEGARLVRATGSERNVVFGHSMGGQLTFRIYQMIPERIDAVVISATIGYFGNKTPEEQAAFVRERQEAAAAATQNADTGSLVDRMLAPGASGPDVELVRRITALTPVATAKAAVAAVQAADEAESVAAIRSIDVPALVVAGAVDTVGRPAGMRRVADMMGHATFAEVADAGHYPWAEHPDAFNALLIPFLTNAVPVNA